MQFYTTSSRINLHYRWIDSGQSNTFVFINALGTDFRIWDEVVELLKPSGNILCFDKQGHGLSSLSDGDKKLTDYMNDLVGLVQHLKISKFHLVGLSVGGMIAQLIAYHHPALIDKLILCNTRHKIGDADGWNARIKQVEESGVASVSESILQRWFTEKFRTNNPGKVEGIRTMLNRCPTQGYTQTCKAIRDADLTETTKQINKPTLVIACSEDLSTPAKDVGDLQELISGSQFKIISDSGHLLCVDNVNVLVDLIKNFASI